MPVYNNSFLRPDHYDHKILDKDGKAIGMLRVKPTGVLWAPKGRPRDGKKFYGVSLEAFADWIMDSRTGATRTNS